MYFSSAPLGVISFDCLEPITNKYENSLLIELPANLIALEIP